MVLQIKKVFFKLQLPLFLSLLILVCCQPDKSDANGKNRTAVTKELDTFFQAQVSEFKLAGLGVCVVKDGKVAWSGGFGLADIEMKRPVTSDTIFTVGSVSKTVTLAAFMLLWEQGKCALDDDVNKYLSFPVRNPRFPDKPITLRMLLSFTAGIFDVDFVAGQNRLGFLE
jgi:CubicO group peptidase (beta-lactamase class C family)